MCVEGASLVLERIIRPGYMWSRELSIDALTPVYVACSVDIKGTFEAKGIEDAAKRLKFVSAEVREPFPAAVKEAGVDTIVMKHFLSGFSDADADIILKHCKEVLPASGKILLLQVCP